MVRPIKRANADDRGKLCRKRIPSSAADLESTPAEFTCSRGTREEVDPAAQRLEIHLVDALPPDPDHDPVPRRLYLKQRFPGAWDVGSLPGLQSTNQWPCTGPPKNVEFALKEKSGRQRKGKPVFAPQPVEWVMLPRGVH